MDCNCDQKWPIEPWAIPQRHQPFLSDQPFVSGRDPKVASGSAVLTWAEEVEMAFSVLIQIGASPLIMLYDPSHSAARQKPQVRLTWDPVHYAFPDMIVTTHPPTRHSNTRLHHRPFTCNLPSSMPSLRFPPRSLLQVAPERPVSTPISAIRNLFCYIYISGRHPEHEKVVTAYYHHCSAAERVPTPHIAPLESRGSRGGRKSRMQT